MGATSRRVGSLRLRALEAEAVIDGAEAKTTKPLADYFGSPREQRVAKARRTKTGDLRGAG